MNTKQIKSITTTEDNKGLHKGFKKKIVLQKHFQL